MSQLPFENIDSSDPKPITEADETIFSKLFGDGRLGEETERAHSTYVAYGANLQRDVTNVLLWARDQGKVGLVLDQLGEHFDSHLQYQHPEIRGLIYNSLGVNETHAFFEDICRNTLGLVPNSQ